MIATKLKNNRFVRFCFVGGISSLIDIALLYALVDTLSLPVLPSAAASFAISSINGYLMNKAVTFGSSSRASTRQYLQFLSVSLVGLGLTLLLLHVLTSFLHIHYLVAKIFTIVIVVFWNYYANSKWTFKNSP